MEEPNLYELIEQLLKEKQELRNDLDQYKKRLETLEKRINHLAEIMLSKTS